MKYDIVLESNGQDLIAKDFHITPISNSIPYNKHVKENLLQYSHQDNIASYYKKISGHFYNNCGDPNLQGLQPIVKNDGWEIDPHDSTYEMGCRRSLYKIYGKQFEFFTPLWLDQISEGTYLNFEFQIFSNQNQELPICKRNFILSPILKDNLSKNEKYHNKLVKYFNDYFTHTQTYGGGNNEVININPATNTASISGINVETGASCSRDLPYLLNNLFSRELPLIEFDNMIISNFENNHMIARQLYNFNLCFNMEDILTKNLINVVMGKSLIVRLFVAICKDGKTEQILEPRDFYTNYEYIPRTFCGPVNFVTSDISGILTPINPLEKLKESPYLNVMNYMRDNHCIHYNTVNKINPSILHWSLIKDNNYICNAYAGFSGYYFDGDVLKNIIDGADPKEEDIHNVNYVYGNSTNINEANYSKSLNQTSWCNHVIVKETDPMIANLDHISNNLDYFAKFATSFSSKFVSGIEYPNGDPIIKVCAISYIPWEPLEAKDNTERLKEANPTYTYYDKNTGHAKFNMVVDKDSNTIFIIGKYGDIDEYLTIKKIIPILQEARAALLLNSEANKFIGRLRNVLESAQDNSQSITLPTTLDIALADGPSISATEIEYYKNDSTPSSPILRVFGKLRPTFVTRDSSYHNLRYSKSIKNQSELSEYNKYSSTKFSPVYKSIGYYFIDEIHEEYFGALNKVESHIYNENKLLILNEVVETTLEVGENENIKDKIREFVSKYYGVYEPENIDYIMSLYKRFHSYEYKSTNIEDINNYVYTIKLELK
jgi:hypothetical protein